MTGKDLVNVENMAIENEGLITSDLIIDWINHCDVSKLTQKSYDSAVRNFLSFQRNNNLDLSEQAIRQYREYLKQNFSTSTARLYFSIIKKFCRWILKKMNCADFVTDIKGIKLDTDVHSRDALTLDEVVEAVSSVKSASRIKTIRDKCILLLMGCCGLRTIEVCRLDIGDIEKRRGKYFLRIWGKARAGKVDSIELPPDLKSLIDEYLKIRGKAPANSPLFTALSHRNSGARLQPQSISRLAKKAMVNVGLNSRRLVAHSFRHSFATAAIQAGVDIRQLSKALRHKSVLVTEVYLHDNSQFDNPTSRIVSAAVFDKLKNVKGCD